MEIPNLIDIQTRLVRAVPAAPAAPARRVAGPPGARGGVPEHLPDREPERRHAARVLRLLPRRAEHQVRRAGVQAEGHHLRHPPEGEDQPRLPHHGRDPSEGNLHGGPPHHDGQGDLRGERRRARGGQPDPPLAGRHLQPREGHLLLAHHPLPRLLARVRDRPEEGAHLRQDRPQEADPRHRVPARPRLRDARVDHRAVLQHRAREALRGAATTRSASSGATSPAASR